MTAYDIGSLFKKWGIQPAHCGGAEPPEEDVGFADAPRLIYGTTFPKETSRKLTMHLTEAEDQAKG